MPIQFCPLTRKLLEEKRPSLLKFEKTLGLSFRKKLLLLAALAHPSYRNQSSKLDLEDFERMEFLGDAILSYVVSRKLYELFPQADEGLLSQLRAGVVSKKLLFRVACELGLPHFILLGKSEAKLPKIEKGKIFSDTLEALIAAVFFDRGMAKTEMFISKHFGKFMRSPALKRMGVSPKNLLQEWVQKKFRILPEYRLETNAGGFVAWALVVNRGKARGEGRTKKDAEERAARRLLTILKKKYK